MVTSAALGEPICPWGGVACKRDERHVRRDALTDPTAELGGLKVLEGLFRRGESPKIGGRVTARGIVNIVPLDQSSFGGGNAKACQELGVEEIKGLKEW